MHREGHDLEFTYLREPRIHAGIGVEIQLPGSVADDACRNWGMLVYSRRKKWI